MTRLEIQLDTNSKLKDQADKLFKSFKEYWELFQKEVGPAAVIWIQDESGELIMYTRGEQADHLINSVRKY